MNKVSFKPKYGATYCFCENNANVPGENSYEIYQNRKKKFTVSNPYNNDEPEDAPICQDYINDTYKA